MSLQLSEWQAEWAWVWKCPKFTLCQPCTSNLLTLKLVGLRVGKQHYLVTDTVTLRNSEGTGQQTNWATHPADLLWTDTTWPGQTPPGFSVAFATKFEAYCNFSFPLKPSACIFNLSYTSFALVSLCFTFPRLNGSHFQATHRTWVFATPECREYFMRSCKLRTRSKNHLKPVQYFLGVRQGSAAWITAGCS